MRILISSKYLHKKLSTIDFDKDHVVSATVTEDGVFVLTTNHNALVFDGAVVVDKGIISYPVLCRVDQRNRRWDWVKQTVGEVGEQPVVLNIFEQRVDVIFQY